MANLDSLAAATRYGLITSTEARMELGTASLKERLAYRFPNRLGWLYPLAADDRLRPGERARRSAELDRRLDEVERSWLR